MAETSEETPCPKREDEMHCNCWYDGKVCCACGDPAMKCCCVIGAFNKVTLVTVDSWKDCPVHGEIRECT